jgi:hypothetical protein
MQKHTIGNVQVLRNYYLKTKSHKELNSITKWIPSSQEMKEPKSNFASNKCQGQNKDTIMRQLDLTYKELINEQKLNDFIV